MNEFAPRQLAGVERRNSEPSSRMAAISNHHHHHRQQQQQQQLSYSKLLEQLAEAMGATIAKLHAAGMVHGDLTTFNMMLPPSAETAASSTLYWSTDDNSNGNDITLIDFGQEYRNSRKRAVDLFVLEHALQSTHPMLPPQFWETVLATV